MLLRSGKTYKLHCPLIIENKGKKPVIDIDKRDRCSICYQTYKSSNFICSCDISKINKHSFHKECMRECFKILNIPFKNKQCKSKTLEDINIKCPYCFSKINKLTFVKIE
jgi:hypothetical protein